MAAWRALFRKTIADGNGPTVSLELFKNWATTSDAALTTTEVCFARRRLTNELPAIRNVQARKKVADNFRQEQDSKGGERGNDLAARLAMLCSGKAANRAACGVVKVSPNATTHAGMRG